MHKTTADGGYGHSCCIQALCQEAYFTSATMTDMCCFGQHTIPNLCTHFHGWKPPAMTKLDIAARLAKPLIADCDLSRMEVEDACKDCMISHSANQT